jgi:hypothetical protein
MWASVLWAAGRAMSADTSGRHEKEIHDGHFGYPVFWRSGICKEIENMLGSATRIILAVLFLGFSAPALTDNVAWQYRVVILKGITAGGTIEKQSNGIYLDTNKTDALNRLAEDD